MNKREQTAAERDLTMGPDFARYLGALLHCAFERPLDYLDEEPGPALKADAPPNRGAVGLAKALSRRDDSCCWTIEVRLTPQADEVDLQQAAAERGELLGLCVIGAENEPEAAELEERLGERYVSYEGDPVPRHHEDGLERSLRENDLTAQVALRWSVERIRAELEEP